ncbi:unnamed protein product [Phyllotreta striolata]|uniref:MADF domain-containing protein n=1 Tax=Phyllotreta striolata TaxID=444603 RepID=A0A9N9XKU7_PHYSR|nr:unnamed protein product [Phyllotreta striolata]
MAPYTFSPSLIKKAISEVKKRPALYNKNNPDFLNKDAKEQLWIDICWELFPNWSDFSEKNRRNILDDLKRKWKNIKDSFRKEIKRKGECPGENASKKRPYVYARELKFMIPFMAKELKVSEEKMIQYSPTCSSDNEDVQDVNELLNVKFENDDTFSSNSSQNCNVNTTQENGDTDQYILGNTSNSIDEDRHFCLSLVPYFKTLNLQQKLNIQIEILQILKTVIVNDTAEKN